MRVMLLIGIGLAAVAGCGDDSGTDRVERAVLHRSVDNYVPHVQDVSCKHSMSGSVGDRSLEIYDCEGRTEAGSTLYFYCSVIASGDRIDCFRSDGSRGSK